jgi:hypothetical protein
MSNSEKVRFSQRAPAVIAADHVYAAYRNDPEAGRMLDRQLGSVLVRPETMLVARDAPLDVATFGIPTVAMSQNVCFHTVDVWPPRNLQKPRCRPCHECRRCGGALHLIAAAGTQMSRATTGSQEP